MSKGGVLAGPGRGTVSVCLPPSCQRVLAEPCEVQVGVVCHQKERCLSSTMHAQWGELSLEKACLARRAAPLPRSTNASNLLTRTVDQKSHQNNGCHHIQRYPWILKVGMDGGHPRHTALHHVSRVTS
eukprot:1137813-Pelagomonas_calceolata.AAC.1